MAQNYHKNRRPHINKKRINIGDTVRLRGDHYRLPNFSNPENKAVAFSLAMRAVRSGQDLAIRRDRELYAKAGDKGVFVELFTEGTGNGEKILYAKVKMETGEIKTFRFTSIELI